MQNVYRIEADRYAVILAGGNASRLMPLTRRITGRNIPKQFCRLVGESSLLAQTHHRVRSIVNRDHTLVVLTRGHEEFYREQLNSFSDAHVLIQPGNFGTATAILLALLRVAKLDPHAVVSVFPSDHYVDNEEVFMCHADFAMRTANFRRQELVILGITPDRDESDYGWIEPAGPLCPGSTLLRVARFWEKPPESIARKLRRQGCLWNTLVMAATVRAFLTTIFRVLPELREVASRVWPAVHTREEYPAMEAVYGKVSCPDFAAEVLTHSAPHLTLLPIRGLYWNDLGTPRRVYETLARMQLRPAWMAETTVPKINLLRESLPRIRKGNRHSDRYPGRAR
jgi:mannose-1-phosphate guanylyltransferase